MVLVFYLSILYLSIFKRLIINPGKANNKFITSQ